MRIIGDASAHRKNDSPSVEADFRITHQTGWAGIINGADLPTLGNIKHLQNARRVVVSDIDFPGLKKGRCIVVIFFILFARHEKNWLAADQRIGRQRLALQLLQRCSGLQLCKEFLSVRIVLATG